ncbi:MAG: hypothetical protein MN733_31575 [Nitrososphaera sp.]|nr:hypothetical protein [Nitrososphaera sp.]
MLFLKMGFVALRLAWPYVLTPWRSPLVRWRMETYGFLDEQDHLLHADDVTPKRFFQFVFLHKTALVHFLRWAALL